MSCQGGLILIEDQIESPRRERFVLAARGAKTDKLNRRNNRSGKIPGEK